MLEGLKEKAIGIGEDVKEFVQEKPLAAAGIGVAALGVAALGAAVVIKGKKKKSNSKRKTGRKIKHTRRGWRQDQKRVSKQKWEKAYQRRKKRSGKKTKKRTGKIYYTKKGQPYKMMASGKARFIKKRKGRKQ